MADQKILRELLRQLNVRKNDTVFFHSSFKRISYLGLAAEEILSVIIDTIGEGGTLLLPSYPWNKTWQGYADYFNFRPDFDVRSTPANIGYIPETFRVMPGVKRSLSYFLPVCAYGKLADRVTRDQEKITNYYGTGSSYAILMELGVKILGLGVSLNTTSISPIVDYMLAGEHTQPVFTDTVEEGVVIDFDSRRIKTYSYWLLPEYVRATKPSRVIDHSERLRKSIYRKDEGDTIQFCYEFMVYFEEALALGRQAAVRSAKMPWLENYDSVKI